MTLLNVEGYSNLKKDTASGGVINVDKNSYESYIATKNIAKRNIQQQKVDREAVLDLQQQINNINTDLSQIRELLVQLVKGK